MFGALAALGLAGLSYLDRTLVQAGLWMFVALTLTSGFFHGALDIVLLQREFASARRLASVTALYAATVVCLAMVCARSGWLMLLLLLSMSVWHFGEPYGRWAQDDGVSRVIAGGAPVMLPALLSAPALQGILPMAVGSDAAWAWTLWHAMAWLWVVISLLGLVAFWARIPARSRKPLWLELGFVLLLNLTLSPLMAFSIYFGALHAAAHIYRVITRPWHDPKSAQQSRSDHWRHRPGAVALSLTCAATLLLLLPLVWFLQSEPFIASAHVGRLSSVLNGLLVALTAVTLPHLILISRNAKWLTRRSVVTDPKD